MPRLRTLYFACIAIIDVAAVVWGVRVAAQRYADYTNPPPPPPLSPPLPPDARMDTIMARHAAYVGMPSEQVEKVYLLPVQFEGDDIAWVSTAKWPLGHSEVEVVRKGNRWVKGGQAQTTMYPRPRP